MSSGPVCAITWRSETAGTKSVTSMASSGVSMKSRTLTTLGCSTSGILTTSSRKSARRRESSGQSSTLTATSSPVTGSTAL